MLGTDPPLLGVGNIVTPTPRPDIPDPPSVETRLQNPQTQSGPAVCPSEGPVAERGASTALTCELL